MSRKHLLGLVCLTITVTAGAAFYLMGYMPKQIAVDSSRGVIPLATSTVEEKTTLYVETVATSSEAGATSLSQQNSEIINPAASTRKGADVVPNPYPMEDLILQPDEVPAAYRPMGVMKINPGFITGDLRSNLMMNSMSPDAIKRMYAGLYKDPTNHYDLFIIAYEYGSPSDLQADLERIRVGLTEEGADNRTTVTVFQNYLIILTDDDNNVSMEFIVQLTDQLRSKLPGYQSSEMETPVTSVGKSMDKLSSSYTMEDLILQPDEVPAGYVPQKTMFDENIANPGFITGDLQNELLLEVGALPALVKRTYGVQYGNYATNDELFFMVLEYETTLGMQAAQKSISASILEQEIEGYATVTAFKNYIIYLYDSESVELATQLTNLLQTKLPN